MLMLLNHVGNRSNATANNVTETESYWSCYANANRLNIGYYSNGVVISNEESLFPMRRDRQKPPRKSSASFTFGGYVCLRCLKVENILPFQKGAATSQRTNRCSRKKMTVMIDWTPYMAETFSLVWPLLCECFYKVSEMLYTLPKIWF